jgi:hypothetical protein
MVAMLAVSLLRGRLRLRVVALVLALLQLLATAVIAVAQQMGHHRPKVLNIIDAAMFALPMLILLTGRPNRARLRIGSAFGAAWALLFLLRLLLWF